MQLPQIITSLLENDLYKMSMTQAILHQFPGHMTTWTFRCRDRDVVFTEEMVEEIKAQVRAYCNLRYYDDELAYLESIPWIKGGYVAFLRAWQPQLRDFEIRYDPDVPCKLSIETHGTWFNTSFYEVPVLAIVNETYFRMAGSYPTRDGTVLHCTYDDLMESFRARLEDKYGVLADGSMEISTFSEFGLRRRLSGEAQDLAVATLMNLKDERDCRSRFIGTSNVRLAMKYGVTPVGTMAHEWIMCVGQGDPKLNPAYSNWFALNAWEKEYGIRNGIALTDTVGTDCFLRDFRQTWATLFSGVRHDSGDPVAWGEKMLSHYETLGVDPAGKTLLFSDSLDFAKADALTARFKGRCQPAFGIGTYLSNDTCVKPLNIVMKVTKCNGMHVAKISDAPGKGMCKDPAYVAHLQEAIDWRLTRSAR